jgi:Protein of unknown function (DUF3224)
MDCQVCGTQLPSEARACPNCGTLTPASYTNSGASPYDPTISAVSGSPPSVMSAPPPPPTQYGANPYDGSLQSPYPVVNPYEAPPPLPPRHPGNHIGIIVGVAILVLLLIGGGVFAWLLYSSANKAAAVTAQGTATAQAATVSAQAIATVTAQAIATATANFPASGTFTILNTTTTSFRQDGQNKIYSYTQHGVNSGDLTGSYTNEETLTLYPDNTGTFSGNITCTCTVAGKSGTLQYSITGTSTASGSFQGQIFDYQGTGDLAKLHGQGVFQGQGLQGTYSSQLHFDA